MTGPPVEPRPGAFGKLPIAADFVAVNASSPGVRGFTEWLQEGVGLGHARLGGSWDSVFPRMPAWRFLLTMGSEGIALAGAVVAGRDRSGRRFPFALFAGVPRIEPTRLGAQLAGLFPFLERAEGEARRLVELVEASGPSPLRPVSEAVEGLSGSLPPSGAGASATSEPWPAISALSDLDPAGAGHLLTRIGGNLMAVAARAGSDGARAPAYGLRAPVPARGPEAMAVVRFWVELACRAIGKAGTPRAIFWSLADGDGRGLLDLYFRPPGTTAFLHRVDRTFESDTLYRLDEADPARPGPAARSWADAVSELCSRDATLEEALARLDPHPC